MGLRGWGALQAQRLGGSTCLRASLVTLEWRARQRGRALISPGQVSTQAKMATADQGADVANGNDDSHNLKICLLHGRFRPQRSEPHSKRQGMPSKSLMASGEAPKTCGGTNKKKRHVVSTSKTMLSQPKMRMYQAKPICLRVCRNRFSRFKPRKSRQKILASGARKGGGGREEEGEREGS